jgi:predicted deacylase
MFGTNVRCHNNTTARHREHTMEQVYSEFDIYMAFDQGYDFGYMAARRAMIESAVVVAGIVALTVTLAMINSLISDNADKIAAGIASVGRGIKRFARKIRGLWA